jgi:hypothetical protein
MSKGTVHHFYKEYDSTIDGIPSGEPSNRSRTFSHERQHSHPILSDSNQHTIYIPPPSSPSDLMNIQNIIHLYKSIVDLRLLDFHVETF